MSEYNQVQQEDKEMSALNEWLNNVRTTFIEAKSLLGTVRELQHTVDGMQRDLDNLRRTNHTLEENLSWHRTERDRLETINRDQATKLNAQGDQLASAQRDAAYWQERANEYQTTIARLAADNDTAQIRVMELEDKVRELEAFKANVLDAVGKVQAQVIPVQEVKPVEHIPQEQPRDPVTQQFRSWNETTQSYDEPKDTSSGW